MISNRAQVSRPLRVAARACDAIGPAVVPSDGDVVFQPRKVDRAGIRAAVDGNVLIYIHKELELEDLQRAFRLSTTSWWTTNCASSVPSRKNGAIA